MRKSALVICVILAVLASVVASANDGWAEFTQKDDNWKKLQSFRIWTIIDMLELDATSEKGIAILEAINRYAEKDHEFYAARGRIAFSLRQALRKHHVDDNEISRLIVELDELNSGYLQTKLEEYQEMKTLLTPLERAKLLMAEEKFRQHLREAMHGPRKDDRKRSFRR